MKRKIKQLFLACMLAAGLLTMAGCSQAEEEMEPLDPALEQALNQEAQQFLEQMAAMDDETIEENLEYFNQEQLTVYASGLNSWKSAKKDLGAYESVESAVSPSLGRRHRRERKHELYILYICGSVRRHRRRASGV